MSGLDPAALQRLQKKWKMNRGEVYDAGYVESFLKDNAALMPTAIISSCFFIDLILSR